MAKSIPIEELNALRSQSKLAEAVLKDLGSLEKNNERLDLRRQLYRMRKELGVNGTMQDLLGVYRQFQELGLGLVESPRRNRKNSPWRFKWNSDIRATDLDYALTTERPKTRPPSDGGRVSGIRFVAVLGEGSRVTLDFKTLDEVRQLIEELTELL